MPHYISFQFNITFTCLFIIIGCSETTFSGRSAENTKKQPQTQEDTTEDANPAELPINQVVDTEPDQPSTDDKKVEEPEPSVPEATEKKQLVFRRCEVVPDYDPLDIRCSINVMSSNSIWLHTDGWDDSSNKFSDKSANWISPLATIRDDGLDLCPQVPASDRLVYVSHFKAQKEGEYTIETLNDNAGYLHLWANGNSKNEVGKWLTNEQYAPKKITLKPGVFSIVVESQDYGVASAVVLSVRDSDNNVIKNTKTDGSWCIFRLTEGQDPIEYVNKASICRKCLTGVEFTGG
ncbi:MAG: hypothetical protein R3B45_02460 [Bdellovibrionota bacterium]